MALDFTKLEFSFSRGLAQKSGPRVVEAPDLVRGVDVEFDEWGELRLRYPFANIGSNIFGGGTISNARRIVKCGDELLLFTQDTLYSWSAQQSAWVSKGTHLALKVDEKPVFVTTGDQVCADRAELSGTIVYTWQDSAAVYVAAVDKTTDAVMLPPTSIGPAVRPRVVALSTKILLSFYDNVGGVFCFALDPASPGTALGGSSTTVINGGTGGTANAYYDVERVPGADAAIFAIRLNPTTSYAVVRMTAALAATRSVKARVCDGPIAITCTPSGAQAQVARGNATNVQGDLLNASTLADVFSGQALGAGTSTINHVTAAFVDATTCHVFWTSNKTTGDGLFDTDHNTVTTANVVGTAATLINRLCLAGRAFAYNGQAYVWLAFAIESSFSGAGPPQFRAQLQNTYLLYRHDSTLQAKAAFDRAAGYSFSDGHLPGVALTAGTTTFSWCGGERRIIPIGEKQSGYSDRGPRDFTFTFDSNEARRCAKIGRTLYISGGLLIQYDGTQLVEHGFTFYPHSFGAIDAPGGSVDVGVHTIKVTWRWDNARGERDRSTTATAGQITITGNRITLPFISALHVTRKTGIAVEVWRTEANGSQDAPFYLVTSQDPGTTAGSNCYIANPPPTNFNDDFADATIKTKEAHPENGLTLENLAPPGASLVIASDTRLFLAGIPGEPNLVVYSKERADGTVCAFHDNLRVAIPEIGGDITGLAFLNETLVVFKETAIYALVGRGYDNNGEGLNYEPRQLSADCGAVSHEAIGQTPMGLVFKSSKGWYLLPSVGAIPQYIGAAVTDYDSETVYAVHAVENRHQVRCLTSGRMLVFDYSEGSALKWAEWSMSDGLHACIWNGTYHYLATAAVKAEQSSYATADYGWDVEVLVHLGGLQGFARVRRILALGEVRGSGSIRFRIGTYQEGTYFDDYTWPISPTTPGAEMQVRHDPSQQQHKAIRVRLTSHTTAGEKPKLTALTLDVGLKPGTFRHIPSAQRT